MITPAPGAMTAILNVTVLMISGELCACSTSLSGTNTAQCILVQLECNATRIILP